MFLEIRSFVTGKRFGADCSISGRHTKKKYFFTNQNYNKYFKIIFLIKSIFIVIKIITIDFFY